MCAGTGRIGSPPRRSSSPSRPRRSAGAMTGRTRPPPSGSSPTSVPFSPSTTVIGLRNSVPSEQAEPVRSLTRRIWLSLFFVCPLAWADDSGITPSAFQIVEEEDASPSCAGTILKVSNATLTDNADGSCSVDTGGGGSGDAVTVNSTAIDTTANFKDTTTITWALIDGGVGGPDDAQATAVDVTCTGCLGTTEVAGLDISADTNLTAGDNLTLTDDDLDLDATVTIATSIASPIFASTTAGVAAAGILRFANADLIAWEVSPAGADGTVGIDASEVIQLTNLTLDGADLTSGSVTSTQLGTDSVSADELNATGVEAELEAALDIGGEVTSTGMASTVIADSVAVTSWNLTTTTLSGTTTLATTSGTLQAANGGIVLPQGTTCSTGCIDGQICYDTNATSGTRLYACESGTWVLQGDGGGSASGKEFWWPAGATLPLEAADSIPPISKDAGTNIDQLPVDFNDSTYECRTVSFKVPATINTGGTATFYVHWYSAAATSGNVILDLRHNSGVAEGVDPDQALTTEASAADAAQGTAGMITITSWTETMSNLAWAAGDQVDAEFCRDANHASDTLVGDMRATGFGILVP